MRHPIHDETFSSFERSLTERWSQTSGSNKLLIAHLTDAHVLAPGAALSGEFPSPTWGQDRLAEIMQEIQALTKTPDVILLGGDLTQTGAAAEWNIIFDTIGLNIPLLVTLGNHEHRNHLPDSPAFETSVALLRQRGLRDGPVSQGWTQVKTIGPYRLVSLDSMHCGAMGAEQHDFLRSELAKGDATVLLVHRPLVQTGHHVDKYRLVDPTFDEILRDAPNVVGVACGHAHRHYTTLRHGQLHLVTPAVNFGNDYRTGYRLFCLADGKMAWSVCRFPGGRSCHSYRGPVVIQQGGELWEDSP